MNRKLLVWIPIIGGFWLDTDGPSDGLVTATLLIVNIAYHLICLLAPFLILLS